MAQTAGKSKSSRKKTGTGSTSGTRTAAGTNQTQSSRAAKSEQMRNSSNAGVRTRAQNAAAREAREKEAAAAAQADRARSGNGSARSNSTRGGNGSTRSDGTRTQNPANADSRTKEVLEKNRLRKAKRKRNRRIRRLICLILVIALIAGGFLYYKMAAFDAYKVTASLELSNSGDLSEYISFKNGYVKITENGVTYFSRKGIIWSENYSMTQPVYDLCRGYIAVADIKQNEVYLFDKDGLVSIVSTEYSIIDVEVSKAGVIAAATDDDDANYIEVYDKSGNELLTARSVFSTSGYLTDISLSPDGTKLAAAFINVDLQDIVSRVVFYDFSEGSEDSDVVVGGFNQYTDTVLTNVEFLDGDRVAAIGDNALTIYDFSGTPEIVYEDLELEWTIDSIFLSGKYIGFITDDSTGIYNYAYHVYNRSGEVVAEGGFDLSYTKAQFYGNYIMVNSANACYIYDFSAKVRFSCAFEENIEAVYPAGIAQLIYATASATNFIRLK